MKTVRSAKKQIISDIPTILPKLWFDATHCEAWENVAENQIYWRPFLF